MDSQQIRLIDNLDSGHVDNIPDIPMRKLEWEVWLQRMIKWVFKLNVFSALQDILCQGRLSTKRGFVMNRRVHTASCYFSTNSMIV